MAERPLLIFQRVAIEQRRKLPRGGVAIVLPSASQQRQRLDAKFHAIAQSFQLIQTGVQGLEPEQVIVLETLGKSVEGLAKAATKIPGLEWLTERDLDDADPSDGFAAEGHPERQLSNRLYAVMSNQQAMDQLLALWQAWDPNQPLARNFGPFKQIFTHLKDIRRWSVQDRIAETRVVDYWQENLQYQQNPIRFEVELWFRANDIARNTAYHKIAHFVQNVGGQCVAQAVVPEILYHGILVEVPATYIETLIHQIISAVDDAQLLRCEDVMFFRPFGQSLFPVVESPGDTPPLRERLVDKPLPSGEPVVALLDGLPLEHHVTLEGRLVIDDPDDFSHVYQPFQQQHGTAMASLIVHDDLQEDADALPRPIYARPIFLPAEDVHGNVNEVTPSNQLLVDFIHRAVRRMKEGEGEEGPTAPAVQITNLSIGNRFQPFDRNLSPLARLLDWLAWKHHVLFLVSVGNQSQEITLQAKESEWHTLADEELILQTLQAMRSDQIFRRPFSPAEAVNILTVGAIHADSSTPLVTAHRIDLLKGKRLPSPLSTVAAGLSRSIKPEILLPGGRQFYLVPFGASDKAVSFRVAPGTHAPGHLVAAPGLGAMELDRTMYSRGTSNATALGTRCAARLYERVNALRSEPGGERLNDEYMAVILKALLVHGASWGLAGETVKEVFDGPTVDWRSLQRIQARFLGYGEVDPERSLFCTDHRVTMLAWEKLKDGEGHVYQMPLPPSLSARIIRRRLTITLAWLTPIKPHHKNYRKAYLWFNVPERELGLTKREVNDDATRRGTVQHRIFEGESATAFVDGATLSIQVNCKENAGKLVEEVPYALAVTLEIADPIADIYNEIRDRIRPVVIISTGTS